MKDRTKKQVEKINQMVAAAEGQRKKIYDAVMSVPQNKDIKQLVKGRPVFEINSSKLSADMAISPSYYDFKVQCAHIVRYLEKQPLEKFVEKLKEMTTPNSSGNYILKGQGYAYRLHPEVVRHIKKLI